MPEACSHAHARVRSVRILHSQGLTLAMRVAHAWNALEGRDGEWGDKTQDRKQVGLSNIAPFVCG